MKKIGNYIVAQGRDLGCREENWYKWIVTDEYGMVKGHYGEEHEALACSLAAALDKLDRAKVDQEVDNILRR